MSADILIVDDEADIRELIAGIMEDEGSKPGRLPTVQNVWLKLNCAGRHWSFWISGCGVASLMELKSFRKFVKSMMILRLS